MSAFRQFLTAEQVRNRLAGTAMPVDPCRPVLADTPPHWPASFVQRAEAGLRPAGVLVPIIERADSLSVLLTQRSAALRLHAGQVSFPGGRMEDADQDIMTTALRETHEEVGIAPDWVEIVGYLPPSPTVTGYSVTPVIGLLPGNVKVTIDPGEVEAAFEVPLEFLMDSSNEQHSMRTYEGVEMPIVEFHHAGRRVWGATAMMLIQLRKLLI